MAGTAEDLRAARPLSEGNARTLLLLLFFLSGGSALIYQVVWVRTFGLVFGVTSLAVSTVLSAFMAGLALGSYVGGRFIDKRRDPLRVFACVEVSIGVFALLFPILLSGLKVVYVLIYRRWPTDFYVFSLLRFTLAFSLLLIPTTLMGATLPILARFFVKKLKQVGPDMGALYSVNNWGAFLGALAAGFVCMETLGVRETSWLAAAISISVGAVSWGLHRRGFTFVPAASAEGRLLTADDLDSASLAAGGQGRNATPPADKESEAARYPNYVYSVVLLVFAIEGFTSLGYEVVWTRMLSGLGIVIDVYTYSLVAATFIAGLAIGSLIIGRLIGKRRDLLLLLGGIEIAIGVSALLLLPLFQVMRDASPILQIPQWGKQIGMTALWVGILMLVPTTLMGATFPVVSKAYAIDLKDLGRRIGKIGFLDTVGSIFGAFAGGFILIPLFGMQRSVVLLAFLNLVIGVAVLLAHPMLRTRWKTVAVGGVAAFASAAWALTPSKVTFCPVQRHIGHVIAYEEGIEATTTVRQMFIGDKILEVNGTPVAGTGPHLEPTQILQGHLPVLIYEALNREQPRSVLTVGLGSGHTSWCLSQHDLERIHCVELVPGVARAAKAHFRQLHHDVFDDPRYRLFFQDARSFVVSTEERYDVIMDDSIHPAQGDNASLYTYDFFADCRKRLSKNGVMSAWIPLFKVSPRDLKMICKSFQTVFPHTTLWFLPQVLNKHALLVGTPRRLNIDFLTARTRFCDPRVLNDFTQIELDNFFAFLNCLLLDEDALRVYSHEAPLHSDDHPYLAFTTPRAAGMEGAEFAENLAALASQRSPILPFLEDLGETEEQVTRATEEVARHSLVVGRLIRGLVSYRRGDLQRAIRQAEQALALAPDHKASRSFLSTAHLDVAHWLLEKARRPDEAFVECKKSLEYDAQNLNSVYLFCTILVLRGELDEAIELIERGLEQKPDYIKGRVFLADCYASKGRLEEAKDQARKAMELLPGEPTVLRRLTEFERLARSAYPTP